jgi:hypothetical protein
MAHGRASIRIALAVTVATLVILLFSPAVNQWYGTTKVPLRFVILDGETGRPVPDAVVRLTRAGDDQEQFASSTGSDGGTKIVVGFRCCGNSTPFKTTRRVFYSLWLVRVNAEGYRLWQEPLSGFTNDRRFHDEGGTPPPIPVRLRSQVRNG